MNTFERQQLSALIRQMDEVRALSNLPPMRLDMSGELTDALIDAAGSLVQEVERHRRRLIETTILLAALSELLAAMLNADDVDPALTSLCKFISGAFRCDWVYVGIEEDDANGLRGPLVHRPIDGQVTESTLTAPFDGDDCALRNVIDDHQTLACAGPEAAAVLVAPDASRLRVLSCMPIGRPRQRQCKMPAAAAHNGTGDGLPGALRGVLAVGRYRNEELDRDHVALLESLSISIGTALENGRLNRRLLEALRFRDDVLESMADGLLAVDTDRRVSAMNEVAAELLGLQRARVLGEPLPEDILLAEGDGDDPLTAALRDGAPDTRRVEGWFCSAAGERRPARFATTKIVDDTGQVVGAMLTFYDLTHIREMEQRLRHLDRIAALGRFTSSVAHEIRNPLAGIAAGIEYLGRGIDEDDPNHAHLTFVMREIGRLERIVSDLSRATRPREPQPRPVAVATLIEDSIKGLRGREDTAQCQIETDIPESLPPALVDPDHLEQVLMNLVLNAVQAGGLAPVIVRSWFTPQASNGRNRLWIAVEDSGPGLGADKLDRIFEPFFTTKREGTGLGLYICHEMVKRNGGEIIARNRPQGGAQFLLDIPHGGTADGRDRSATDRA